VPVLAVDDNATNRRILEEMLTGWPHDATLADGAQPALACLEQAV
jgi:two-component system, sensor histidine kinase and response regulator